MLKIIHTGDLHLGAKFISFGKNASLQRRALLDSFKKVVDAAILKKAQMLLISGDLFDSNFPSYETVNFVKSEFKKLDEARIFVAVLPGTHDCLSKDSIYKRENFAEGLSHIYIFSDEAVVKKEYPELNLSLYAQANTSNKSKKNPLNFLASFDLKNDKSKYKVAMAHGSVQIEGKSADDDWPIQFSDISKSGMDYIALGHWHGAQDFSFGDTKAWYCGSPEITYKEGKGGLGQGYAMEVDFLETADVKQVKISKKEVKELSLDIGLFSDIGGLYKEIDKLAGENIILIVNISGMTDPSVFVDAKKIEEDFSDKFFSIKLSDNSSFKLEDIADRDYPEEMVIGQFIRSMNEKILNTKDEEEEKILKDALQIGVAELEGKEVL